MSYIPQPYDPILDGLVSDEPQLTDLQKQQVIDNLGLDVIDGGDASGE
jgi:hypothetical protein